MRFRFRLWMPLLAVLIVLLSIVTLLLYVLPVARSRLGEYAQSRTIEQAAATAEILSGTEGEQGFQRKLEHSAEAADGEIIVVDTQGRLVAREGSAGDFEPSEEMLQNASVGSRMFEKADGLNVAVVPIVTEGTLTGGIVFASDEPENTVYQLFLLSGIEAAAVASVLGGGLALLLATLLSRRVERLALSARAIGRGDLSERIEPGFDDELGELARTFNSMAEKLENAFLQLEERGATLNTILDNLAEGVLATDLSGNIVFMNRCARVMLSVGDEESFEGTPDPWNDFDLPEAVDRCAKKGECPEVRVSEGENFFQVKLEHMPAFDNHRGGVLVMIRDLSEGRRLEANQQRFLANAAHELKTPITTILGASELLLTEEEEDPETRRRFLNHIFAEARRMQQLSETLLRLARTGVDSREPEAEVVDLDDAAREAAERMDPLAESAGLGLHVAGRGGRVRADREWLEQGLLVVLGNAIQHSERGGEVRLRVEGGAVTVEDDGVGISEDDLPYVFERFYRGKRSPGGFGLGLAICKDLVERMGGSIRLESKEGAGTKVEIELPEVGANAEDTDS